MPQGRREILCATAKTLHSQINKNVKKQTNKQLIVILTAGEYSGTGRQWGGGHVARFSVQLDVLEGCVLEALEEGCLCWWAGTLSTLKTGRRGPGWFPSS